MNTEWNTAEPPKDGTLIVAIGKVMFTEDACTTAEPFLAQIRWTENPGESKGWHYPSGMAVAASLEDEVIIHWWMPYPSDGPRMRIVCAWCQADLGTKECCAEQAGKISHSICPACMAKAQTARQPLEVAA